MTKHHAECQCGQLTVDASADPDFSVVCNCRACQKRTGSPFGTGAYFRRADLAIGGESRAWSRRVEAGRVVTSHFCPKCGTSLYWTLDLRPDHMGVAYGCLDRPLPDPVRAIWTSEKHDWVLFPEAWPQYEGGSPS